MPVVAHTLHACGELRRRADQARSGLLVRRLPVPGLIAETESILRYIASTLTPTTYVNLMAQ
jgi:uncharacterized Fe-S radical SAM superfamily protein PflX